MVCDLGVHQNVHQLLPKPFGNGQRVLNGRPLLIRAILAFLTLEEASPSPRLLLRAFLGKRFAEWACGDPDSCLNARSKDKQTSEWSLGVTAVRIEGVRGKRLGRCHIGVPWLWTLSKEVQR